MENKFKNLYYSYYNSPMGILEIITDNESLRSVLFVDEKKKSSKVIPTIMTESYKQFKEYFNGERKNFDLKLTFEGTDFQKKVWKELMSIPYGQVVTYKDIAIKVGNPRASRAVGNANNKNKLLIVVPCHRVIGSNGKLNGYNAGLQRKERLINHEKVY